jgi:hypothetical protein
MEVGCKVASIATGGHDRGWDPTQRLGARGPIGLGNGLGAASTLNRPRCRIDSLYTVYILYMASLFGT